MFDTFRGLLMWSIPISHFTRVAGHFSQGSLSGVVYITINVFVMQAFVFLSGYFSKKPERARETSFHTFLWPYLICIPFFYCVRYAIYGNANWNLDVPPFALWYLFALFFYRFFLKDYIKIPYVMEISLLLFLFAGQLPFLSEKWALGRMVSYFPEETALFEKGPLLDFRRRADSDFLFPGLCGKTAAGRLLSAERTGRKTGNPVVLGYCGQNPGILVGLRLDSLNDKYFAQ